MGSEGVVNVQSFGKFMPHMSDRISKQVGIGIEFFLEGTVTSFNTSVVLGFSGREH
jgi:hypothetical protein